jgi:triphosphatase
MSDEERGEGLPDGLRAGENREIELKLAVPAGDLSVLKRHPLVRSLARSRPVVRHLQTVYYDTPDRDLSRARLALRVRRSGRSFVQALKGEGSSVGGLFVRGEWESRLPDPAPDVERIPSLSARALARRVIGGRALEPVFESEFQRTSFRLRRGDTELSLDFDEGELRARGRTLPIREIELELASGDAGVLHGIALELHETLPLRIEALSKAERGYALATGARPGACRAPRIELAPGATLEDALREVLAACLGQVLANLDPAAEGEDPEGVHQLRVGLRRTRAALALLRDVLPADEARSFRGELRWLAAELGPVRDLDVFLAEVVGPLAERFPDDPSLKRLRDAARELRDEAQRKGRLAIEAPRTGALTLALGGWLAARAWRRGASEEQREQLAAPAAERGARLLERRYRKVRKLGRGLARRTPAERHRLRIELKKLRYASEFLGSLFSERAVERSLGRITALQDTLGALNDVATVERLVGAISDRLGREWGADAQRAAGFLEGWTAHEASRRLARLEKQWKGFRRTAPFWGS